MAQQFAAAESGGYGEAADASPVVQLVMEESRRILAEMAGNLKIALDMSLGAGGPALYEPMLLFDLEQTEKMLECKKLWRTL